MVEVIEERKSMNTKTTGVWLLTVVAAAAAGWFAAIEVSRGPAFKSEQDAYERFSNAFTVTDAMDRAEVVARLVRRLTPETLPGAVRAFKDDQKDIFNNDLRMLMWYWAQQDPRGMLEEMQGWSEVRSQRIAAGEAVYWVLKQEGYDAARALFDQLPNHQRDPALAYLVLAYLESGETVDLLGLIESYQSRDEREFATGIVAAQVLKTNGPELLARWVEALPEGPGTSNDLKAVAFRAAQSELMRRDEFEFLEAWIDRVDAEPWTAGGGRRTIGVHLAKRDPMRAIAWAQALPPEKGRDEVLGETLRAYASHDRVGALAWTREQPPSPMLDAGTARLVYEFMTRDPQVALEMLARIQGAEAFEKAHKMVSFAWRNTSFPRHAELTRQLEAMAKPGSGATDSKT